MNSSKKNEFMHEMDTKELEGINGGIGFFTFPSMPLEILKKAYDKIIAS